MALRWVSRQLVKAKPEFHKKTFLKPLHKSAEFCGACHKVHLPQELNHYKWLRGQNHYDSFLLSGVSGHFVASFYYPAKAEPNCGNCHINRSSGNLNFATYPALMAGTGGTAVVVSQRAGAASVLVEKITNGEMPPGNPNAVSDAEVATLVKWITEGAFYDGTDPMKVLEVPLLLE